jgi:hypothetical protein
MKTTYQIVTPPTAPGLPSPRYFTQDASQLVRAPVGSVIVVQAMSDEDFAAIPATTESRAFFA